MAIKTGIDRLGRRFKTVNGKRVQAVDAAKTAGVKGHATQARVKAAIDQILRHWVHGARGKKAVGTAITQMLQSKFGRFLNVPAKTAVGRYGRLYASLYMLRALDISTSAKELADEKGDLDQDKFRAKLESAGVEIPDSFDSPPISNVSPGDDDAAILAIVHRYGLDAQRLEKLLASATHDNSE